MGISAQRGVERPPGLSDHPAVPKRRFFHPKASSPLVLQPRGCRYPDLCDLQRFILRVILPAASALPIELPRGASDANGFPKGPFSKSRAQLKPGLAAQGPAGNRANRCAVLGDVSINGITDRCAWVIGLIAGLSAAHRVLCPLSLRYDRLKPTGRNEALKQVAAASVTAGKRSPGSD